MISFVIAFAVLARILFGMWRDSKLPPAIQLRLPEYDEALEVRVEPKTALDMVVNAFMFWGFSRSSIATSGSFCSSCKGNTLPHMKRGAKAPLIDS